MTDDRHRLRRDDVETIGAEFDIDPEGIPETVDEAAIERMRFVAKLLDESVEVPRTGFRVGLDPILGVIPGIGDAIAAGIGLYLVVEAARLGVSVPTLLRMIANIGVDAALGSIPVLGPVFDAIWLANRRNFELALLDLAATGDDPDHDHDDTDDRARDGVEIDVTTPD
ncbi:DUF4112 domain-containing protein [Halobacteriales archaeon SW_7_68_16]|nr:MAG: DUF4112 domain-containing protein [Halobacteriales archaeon SW_7_68_16]